jgi:hypothetical protein
MRRGSIGSNQSVSLIGGEISGEILLAPGGAFQSGSYLEVGTKLDPPRSPAKASQNYVSGSPAVPNDTGYEYIAPFDPQWDKDGDSDTDASDYDWVIQNGGLEGGGSTIPYTQPGDPTIKIMDKGVPETTAIAGTHYTINANHEFEDKNNDLYFTGTQYRFNKFKWGTSKEFYFGTKVKGVSNDTTIFTKNWAQTGSGDMIIKNDRKVNLCIRDDVDISGSGKYNEGGKADQFNVFGSATTVDITGSGDAVAGEFYFPNGDIDIAGSGIFYLAIVGKSITKTGSGDICYPADYEGPPGGGGGGIPTSPPEREDWKEIIAQ